MRQGTGGVGGEGNVDVVLVEYFLEWFGEKGLGEECEFKGRFRLSDTVEGRQGLVGRRGRVWVRCGMWI